VNRLPFVFAGLAFGAPMGLLAAWLTQSAAFGVRAGVVAGAAFGFGLWGFVKATQSSPALELDGKAAGFDADEKVLHHGPANHFKGIESVGGKLFLTSRRLRFRSHALNVQAHDESFPLADIATVEPTRTLGIVPNGIRVTLRDGRRERFVVTGRATWVAQLLRALGSG